MKALKIKRGTIFNDLIVVREIPKRGKIRFLLCRCRWVTKSINAQNKRPTNKLGVKGIYKSNAKYQAQISKDGIWYNLGVHKTKKSAAKAYDTKAIELYGKHACTNKSLGLI